MQKFHTILLSFLVGLISGVVSGGILEYKSQIGGWLWPRVEIQCPTPAVIFSHKYKIHGTYTSGYKVAIYVYIYNGTKTHKYWHQIPIAYYPDAGVWSISARFGNPFMIDHYEKEEPIYFLYAVLYEKGRQFAIQEEEKGVYRSERKLSRPEFEDVLKRAGAEDVSSCRIQRKPERILKCSKKAPQITWPEQHTCLWHVDTLLSDCDPTTVATVPSPITFKWEDRNESMYAELYRKGEAVEGFPREKCSMGRLSLSSQVSMSLRSSMTNRINVSALCGFSRGSTKSPQRLGAVGDVAWLFRLEKILQPSRPH